MSIVISLPVENYFEDEITPFPRKTVFARNANTERPLAETAHRNEVKPRRTTLTARR